MDYRKFLGQAEEEVLPYLGGAMVTSRTRRLRVANEAAPGWWRFRVAGRVATPIAPADAPDLAACPLVRGHFAGGWLFAAKQAPLALSLLPTPEPEALAPVAARRWGSGVVLFEAIDFEGDAEPAARAALERLEAIAALKGVGATLRAAYGYALLLALGEELGVPVALPEVRAALKEVAEGGRTPASVLLLALARRREEYRQRERERAVVADAVVAARRRARAAGDWRERAAEALEKGGAELVRGRDLGDGQAEVHFACEGQRFIAAVDQLTLQIVDAGICLSGRDRVLNLASLPPVIRQAIDEGRLVITRR
jgi:hypothetical protein